MRRWLAMWLVGWALLCVAWIGANPPGSAPDEPAHHVKAVAAAHGQFTGVPVQDLAPYPPIRRPFLAHVLRTFRLPARLATDPRWGCNAFTPDSAACLKNPLPDAPDRDEAVPQDSILGPYIPAPYLILGSAARLAGAAGTALYAERMASALVSLAMLTVATLLVTSKWARLAILLAVTPTVIFTSSVITTSGIEITAGLAHAAAIVGLVDRPLGKGPWLAWAASGAALVLVRPLGALWLAMYLALLLALVGPTALARRVRAERRKAGPAIALLGFGALLALAWAVLVMPSDIASMTAARGFLAPAVRSLPELLRQAVGVFGWLDVGLPPAIARAVGAAWAAVLVGALVLGTARHRLILGSAAVSLVVLVIGLQIFTQMPFGFSAQARYVMPLSVGTLLIAGWSIDVRLKRDSRTPRRELSQLTTVIVVGFAGLQWAAWYVNARRSAVGLGGPWLFVGASRWEPPIGWIPWLAVATLGSALLVWGAGYCVARSSADVEGPTTS